MRQAAESQASIWQETGKKMRRDLERLLTQEKQRRRDVEMDKAHNQRRAAEVDMTEVQLRREVHWPRPLAHVRALKVQRQVLQVQALQALALLVPQAPSSRRCPPSCPYFSLPFLLRTVLGALGVRHGVAAGTQRLSASCYQKVLKRFFQLFVVPLLLVAAGVGFLLLVFDEENVLLLKYIHPRITQCQR